VQDDYEVVVIRKGDNGWFLSRKIVFSRVDLEPHRQYIYDEQGTLVTDARYADYKDYDGVIFPSRLEIYRPEEEYDIVLNMLKVEINKALQDDEFVLGMPTGVEEWDAFLAQHYKSLMAYEPRPYPGRVALFRARALPVSRLHRPDLGWGRMAGGGIEINIVPGSHENILREPYVEGLARALRRALDEVDKKVGDVSRVP
jgi:hypothetical protein